MQALEEPKFIINEFTDMNSNYSDWEKNFFSDDILFSDSESDFTPLNFIKSSQNFEHKIARPSPMEMASLCKIRSNHETIATLLCKGKSLSELNTIKEYNLNSAQNPSQNVVCLKQGNIIPNTKRKSNNCVCSKNFHTPIKKFKAEMSHKNKHLYSLNEFSNEGRAYALNSTFKNKDTLFYKLEKCEGQISVPTQETEKSLCDSVIDSSQVISSSQTIISSNKKKYDCKITTSNQENCSNQKITTSSQKNSSCQKMTTSSQNNSSSQRMTTSSQSSGSQRMATSSQSSGSQRMTMSSQSSSSQRMTTSSQENFSSQNMITSSQESSSTQKMITSSQEHNSQTMITSSQEHSNSQTMITSSQEKLSIQVMNISIEGRLDSPIITTKENSVGKKFIFNQEKNKNFEKIISNQQNANKLQINEQQNVCSSTNPSKRFYSKIHNVSDVHSANKPKQSDIVASTGSIKNSLNQYVKEEKIKMNWRIRKRELSVTKRENDMMIREKQLDEREANLLKRERMLKTKEKRYWMQRVKMKGNSQKLMNNSKQKRQCKQEIFLTQIN